MKLFARPPAKNVRENIPKIPWISFGFGVSDASNVPNIF